MSLSEIRNFIEIDGRTATGGQPSEAQLRDARAQGFEAILNLAPDGLETSLAEEANLVAALGMRYHHIPVMWSNPRPEDLDAFMRTMDALTGRRVLIHCQANFRVTAFYGIYAVRRLGWAEQQASDLIDSVWARQPGAMDETWRAFIADGMARR
ncbi:MAG: protein tyrosine phosphatase family protein [Sphingomonadaceae bacterium]|nr:protein tyrosine phosphatase family protein [Sphingomonadaceae bacterium]